MIVALFLSGYAAAVRRVQQGRTDYVIVIVMPEEQLRKSGGGRNVLMKPGVLRLSDYKHSFYYRKDGKLIPV